MDFAQHYVIREGKNFSGNILQRATRALLDWNVVGYIGGRIRLGYGWMARNPHSVAKDDYEEHIHKLFGLAEGWDHHGYSMRLGLKRVEERIALYAYGYRAGKMSFHLVCMVDPDQEFTAEIFRFYGRWLLLVTSEDGRQLGYASIETHTGRPLFFHRLYPHYSGKGPGKTDAPAPVDVETEIYWL